MPVGYRKEAYRPVRFIAGLLATVGELLPGLILAKKGESERAGFENCMEVY
jgi:hypothetical protein